MKILKRIALFITLLCLGGFGMAKWVLPYVIIMPAFHKNLPPVDYNAYQAKRISLMSDTVELKGFRVDASARPKGLIIFVHGIGGRKEAFLPLATQLASQNISSVCFDNRAHGESGGDYCTYGYEEKQDIKKMVDMLTNELPGVPIGIWGSSLGGAIAIHSLEYDERIRFGVIESTFADFSQIVDDYLTRLLFGLHLPLVAEIAVENAVEIANFPLDAVNPISAVPNIEQPVFIAHGNQDKHIRWTYGKALYDGLASEDKEWYLVEGAAHSGMRYTGGLAYEKAYLDFVLKQLDHQN